MDDNRIKVLVIAGPTASGKTALATALAKRLNGEIISCDSMQIYKGMIIGTAAPSKNEMCGIPHHMIGICDPRHNYSAADYSNEASHIIREVSSRGKLPIVCGGTGLYLDSLLKISEFSKSNVNSNLRNELEEFALEYGHEALHKRLMEVDKASAQNIHPNNVKRVIRALEIYDATGIPKSILDKNSLADRLKFDADIVTIDFLNRETLYKRINDRVDMMIDSGLENEVKDLYEIGMLIPGTTASQAIGYKEMLAYIEGKSSFAETVELIKKSTRNYAKRQITWFKRYKSISIIPDLNKGIIKDSDILAEEVIENLQ